MKRFLTTAAIVTALALPAFAEGDDPSAKTGEPKAGSAKASTDAKQDAGSGAMGGAVVVPRATTGAANPANTDDVRNPAIPRQKTGVSGSGDGGGSGGSGSGGAGGSGGSGGSGGGSQ